MLSDVCLFYIGNKERVRLDAELNVNQLVFAAAFDNFIGFVVDDDGFFFHFFESLFDFGLVVAKLRLFGKPDISDDGRE